MRGNRALSAVVVALLVTGLLPGAAAAQSTTTACPARDVPATGFEDTVTSPHRAAIDCAAWWGLVEGLDDARYAPGQAVTRGQTAAMIARLLRSSGHAPDEVTSAGFEDTDGHVFEPDIDLIAELGIVTGTSATTFEPDRPITREQMASILTRTFELAYDAPLADGSVADFDDVDPGDTHAAAIGQLVAAGITTGTSATTFAPTRAVTRAQMASFTTRSASELVVHDLLELPEQRPADDDAYASRTRAAWVHLFDDTLKTRRGIERLVDELAAADANTVIAQVIRRHDAYYDSSVLPATPDPQVTVGFDVLDELIAAAHARDIEVHAWFSVAPTWHGVYADLPAPEGWLAVEHGHLADPEDRWVTKERDEDWSDDDEAADHYLDPGVPAVRRHVAQVVGELVTEYPVDGIHLDYVRYPSADHGYNPRALRAYRAQTGATGTPDEDDREWTRWRRAQSRRIIDTARDTIEAADSDAELSAAVITWQDGPPTPDRAGFRRTMSYTRVLQNWDAWARSDRLDAVMPMNYFRGHDDEQARWFDEWLAYERALAADVDTEVVPGPGGYLNRPGNALAQVRAAMGVDGASLYSYQQPTLDGSREIWQQLARTRWGYHPQR